MPRVTCSRGSVSRTIPNASGPTAAPPPWTMRPAISSSLESATAQIRLPTMNAPRPTSRSRRRPNRSPRRPNSGTATTDASRNPVANHETEISDAEYSWAITGSAGRTIDDSSPKSAAPNASTSNPRSESGLASAGPA
jgi:hypothetical protein